MIDDRSDSTLDSIRALAARLLVSVEASDPRDAQPALRGVLNVAWHPEHGFERGRYAVDAQEASVVG